MGQKKRDGSIRREVRCKGGVCLEFKMVGESLCARGPAHSRGNTGQGCSRRKLLAIWKGEIYVHLTGLVDNLLPQGGNAAQLRRISAATPVFLGRDGSHRDGGPNKMALRNFKQQAR